MATRHEELIGAHPPGVEWVGPIGRVTSTRVVWPDRSRTACADAVERRDERFFQGIAAAAGSGGFGDSSDGMRNAIFCLDGDAIAAAITRSVDVTVDDSQAPGTVTVTSTPDVQFSIAPGESATFSITVTGTLAAPLTLTFRDAASNTILGTAVLTFDGAGNPSLAAGTSGTVSLP